MELFSEQAVLEQLKQEYSILREEANARLKTALANRDVVLSYISLVVLENAVSVAEARLSKSMIKSPINGRILKIFTWPGETIREQPILQMGEIHRMYAVAEVYETDIGKVKAGQRAVIESPAIGKPIAGTVERLGSIIHKNDILDIDPTAATDSRVIEVDILLDDPETASQFNNHQVEVRIES